MDGVALARLDALCDRAQVVSMAELNSWQHFAPVEMIGMRHDCDDRAYDSILPLAEWEARRNRRSTFYLLHTAPWYSKALDAGLPQKLAALGHEVGLHYNWAPSYEKGGVDPRLTLDVELRRLRATGVRIGSVAGHGDDACYRMKLVNYGLFVESGPARYPWRDFTEETGLDRVTCAEYGLDFLAEFVPKWLYISDSGDEWQPSLAEAEDYFPADGPTVILQHPDWYSPRLFA